jgi:hypothetical protein
MLFRGDTEKTGVFIEIADNGYILHMMRPKKAYAPGEGISHQRMLFLNLSPCLQKAEKFLNDPWGEKDG